jgi:hypothetical protein
VTSEYGLPEGVLDEEYKVRGRWRRVRDMKAADIRALWLDYHRLPEADAPPMERLLVDLLGPVVGKRLAESPAATLGQLFSAEELAGLLEQRLATGKGA